MIKTSFIFYLIHFLCLFGCFCCNDLNKLPGLEKFDKMRVNERNFQLVRNIHANWFATGLKALMGSLGRALYQKLSKEEQKQLADCLFRVEDKMDLVLAANCLVNARRRHFARIISDQVENDYYYKMRWKRNGQNFKTPSFQHYQHFHKHYNRTKRTKNNKFGTETRRMFFENIKLKKQNNKIKTIRQQEQLNIINNKRRESLKLERMHKFEIKQQEHIDKLLGRNDQSAIVRVANLISTLTPKNENNRTDSENNGSIKWTKMYEFLVHLKRENDKRSKSPGARAYNMRMYDLVLGRDEPTMSQFEQESPQGLLKMGISLLNKLTNQNASNNKSGTTNFKFMSPRLAPLMPDNEANKKSLFSPTIFALYENEESEEIKGDIKDVNLVKSADSLPKVLRTSGVKTEDRQALLQMLMQLSGSIGHVHEAIELLKSLNFFEIEPDLREANKKIINAYKKVEHSFDDEQRYDIDNRGWTYLDSRQFDQLCQEQHADFPEELKTETERFSRLDRIGREQALWKRIERIARNIPDEYADRLDERRKRKMERLHRKFRFRRQAGVEVGKAVILAPFMFTPTIGLSVLGPLILSPSIFAPQILAPSVLSPFVLSPGAPMPFILSPFVFGPFILSPMALAPFILTPYVLSPNILNPYALSPLILSPNVLSPDILSPQVLGGGILSPTVGSPEVLTESALMASVLSPSVLS